MLDRHSELRFESYEKFYTKYSVLEIFKTILRLIQIKIKNFKKKSIFNEILFKHFNKKKKKFKTLYFLQNFP